MIVTYVETCASLAHSWITVRLQTYGSELRVEISDDRELPPTGLTLLPVDARLQRLAAHIGGTFSFTAGGPAHLSVCA